MNEREHAPYHERRLEQQQLDALLRIEELLKAFLVLLPVQEEADEPEELKKLYAEAEKELEERAAPPKPNRAKRK
jgi:phosphoenolpyruvate-protein kinase (PTS system EI component)